MKPLFGPSARDILAPLSTLKVLLAFDFDGTLAPIVADRDDAQMRPVTMDLFRKVCRLFPCTVISGRSQADVASRLGNADVLCAIGNHGMEPGGDLDACRLEVAEARELLVEALAAYPGIDVEDKVYSLALHYRHASAPHLAQAAIHSSLRALPRALRAVPGKLVVNLVPAHAPHKGHALMGLRDTVAAEAVLFVGDDVTDEDVFALGPQERILSVRVGESRSSAAPYFLQDQEEIDVLLAKLVQLREK